MDRMEEHPPLTDRLVGIFVLAMVGTQTWVIINEATDGELGRRVQRWWDRSGRPWIVRLVTWLDACAITERMVAEEIEPLLKREAA